MKIVFFVHSIVSDWNNGHVHFLRGLMAALQRRGHQLLICEQRHNWSTRNLFEEEGAEALLEFAQVFAHLPVAFYEGGDGIIEEVELLTRGADLVIVHEFNEPELVGAVADVRRRRDDFLLLFHDTHHRALSVPQQIARLNLAPFDGVLAFGEVLTALYRHRFGFSRAWTLHEAADIDLFQPLAKEKEEDVVWIGNWGDEERSSELRAYLVEPARALPRLRFSVHGVRYPEPARAQLAAAGIAFRGRLANHRVPQALARARLTIHIPRRYYRQSLPGVPTIRPFEAMACGIPLISLPWPDPQGLFRAGRDYLLAHSPEEMAQLIKKLTQSAEAAATLAASGLQRIRAQHTCDHRADELASICQQLGVGGV
jgi:spore maturation protein CgeB